MDPREDAIENLRVIRALLDRAAIYRAISAPTALAGGLLSLAAAAAPAAAGVGFGGFLAVWAAVLFATLGLNGVFIWRGAARRGEPVISSGMRLAVRHVAPAAIAGAGITAWHAASHPSALSVSVFWAVFYGLMLLSTAEFAPRSIARLGWAFLWTGLLLLPLANVVQPSTGSASDVLAGSLAMGISFGLLHLVYAACAWPAAPRESEHAPG